MDHNRGISILGIVSQSTPTAVFWLIVLVIIELISGYRNEGYGNRQGCVWSNTPIVAGISSSSSSSSSLSSLKNNISIVSTLDCNLRTLNSEFWNYTFTSEQRYTTHTVHIKCNDKLFFESFLTPNQSLFQLQKLEYLSIESCKIRKIISTPGIWSTTLKTLVLHTYNGDWLNSIGLEIESNSFDGIKNLENLDLSFNNIWVIPEKYFLCSLKKLNNLNMSHNHLTEISNELNNNNGNIGGGGGGVGDRNDCGTTMSGSTLEILDMSYNIIRRIGPNGFSRLKKLTQLYLQNNYIEELEDSTLYGLKNLHIINLSDNRLVAIPPYLFNPTINLIELHLKNNSLSALSQDVFIKLEHLQILDLSKNTLTSQWVKEYMFKSLTSLITLKLSFNQLSYIDPIIFKNLITLQSMYLDNNRIENISPEAFSSLTNLQFLDLSRNRVSMIDSRVLTSFCFVLKQLYLDHNRIRRMDEDSLKNCTNIQDLGIAGNILPEVPIALRSSSLSLLRTVDLGENRIVEVNNESFEGLGQLYGLRLVDNRINGLPIGFCNSLGKLRVLNLAQNRINYISPGAFKGCPELRALRLDTNLLEEIPTMLPPQLPSLLWLNISENHLKRVDYSTLPETLEWLDLSYNSIESLGGGLFGRSGSSSSSGSGSSDEKSENDNRNVILRRSGSNLNPTMMTTTIQIQKFHLRVLDASHNRLRQLDYTTIPYSLETLRLNYNELKNVAPDTFIRSPRLRRIELVGNQLKNLPLSALRFSPIPIDKALPQVYLGGNPFLCDCSMEWLTRVNHLTALRQYPRIMDTESIQCTSGGGASSGSLISTNTNVVVGFTHNFLLQDSKPSDFLCPYKSHCFPLCHCCEFDACDCEMTCPENCTCYHDKGWSSNIVECSNLNLSVIPERIPMDATRIHLDGNDIQFLPSHLFIGKKNLRTLHLNGSHIEFVKNKTFNGLKSLEILRLEQNLLTQLQGYEFTDLENLKELYLNNNLLHFIAQDTFEKLKFLQILNLNRNFLIEFNIWQLSGNGYLNNVMLSNNPWSCECEFIIPFRTWITSKAAGSSLLVQDFNLATCQTYEITTEHEDIHFTGNTNEDKEPPIISIPIMSVCNHDINPGDTDENNHISTMGGASTAFASSVTNDNESPTDTMNSNLPSEDTTTGNNNSTIFWIVMVTGCILVIIILTIVILLVFYKEIQFRCEIQKQLPLLLHLCICCTAGGKKSTNNGRNIRSSTTRSLSGNGSGDNNSGDFDNDKLFDAYFLYSRRDEEILTQKLTPELEHESIHSHSHGHSIHGHHRCGFRLCLHYRDLYLTPNSENPWNPEMVLSACDASKRVVLFLSRTFLQSEWTTEDFRLALSTALSSRQTCKKLILVLLPPLNTTSLLNSVYVYPELRLALSTGTVLNWTDDNFWTKFKLLLPSPTATTTTTTTHINSISQNCHYCGTIQNNSTTTNLPSITNFHPENHQDRSYTNLNFGSTTTQPNFIQVPIPKDQDHHHHHHWPMYHPPNSLSRIIPPPQQQQQPGFIALLPPIQFTTGHSHHPNYHHQHHHQHENSLSTISNTYRPLTEQNFSDSTNTIGSSSNEELDHIYSTLDSPIMIQSPGSINNSPKIIHRSSGSSSSGIGSGNMTTSPSEIGGGPPPTTNTTLNNGQMYFV